MKQNKEVVTFNLNNNCEQQDNDDDLKMFQIKTTFRFPFSCIF